MPDVVLYTGDACSFCRRAKSLLVHRGVPFREEWVDRDDADDRRRLVDLTGGYTLPQITVDGQPLGGWFELAALDRDGRLEDVLSR